MVRPETISKKLRPWIEARKRHQLTDIQVQMARELALKPRKLGERAGRGSAFPGQSVSEWVEQQYRVRFGREAPEEVRSLEERAAAIKVRKEERQARRKQRKPPTDPAKNPAEEAPDAARPGKPMTKRKRKSSGKS